MSDIMERYELRNILPEEAQQVVEIEQICFPPNEACTPQQMRNRVESVPNMFLVAVSRDTGALAGFVNGIATDETTFRDEFFMDEKLHNPEGRNVMILGLDVLPEHRNRGLASALMNEYARIQMSMGREAMYLTCHDRLVPMYRHMGYELLGESGSVWGGVRWQDMVRRMV